MKFDFVDDKGNNNVVHYDFIGKKNASKNIVIMHGWGQNRSIMKSIGHFLSNDYNVYNFDLPGFGESKTPDNWSVGDYAKMIAKFIIDKKLENTILIGHSFGGRIAIYLAGQRLAKVKSLVLIGSAGFRKNGKISSKIKELMYKALIQATNLPIVKINKLEYQYNLKQIFGSKDYLHANEALRKIMINVVNQDLANEMEKIDVPTLLFWGRKDEDTPLKDGFIMSQKIKKSQLHVFENAGHYPFIETKEEFFGKLGDCLIDKGANNEIS